MILEGQKVDVAQVLRQLAAEVDQSKGITEWSIYMQRTPDNSERVRLEFVMEVKA